MDNSEIAQYLGPSDALQDVRGCGVLQSACSFATMTAFSFEWVPEALCI
jgi:hypothetical protein